MSDSKKTEGKLGEKKLGVTPAGRKALGIKSGTKLGVSGNVTPRPAKPSLGSASGKVVVVTKSRTASGLRNLDKTQNDELSRKLEILKKAEQERKAQSELLEKAEIKSEVNTEKVTAKSSLHPGEEGSEAKHSVVMEAGSLGSDQHNISDKDSAEANTAQGVDSDVNRGSEEPQLDSEKSTDLGGKKAKLQKSESKTSTRSVSAGEIGGRRILNLNHLGKKEKESASSDSPRYRNRELDLESRSEKEAKSKPGVGGVGAAPQDVDGAAAHKDGGYKRKLRKFEGDGENEEEVQVTNHRKKDSHIRHQNKNADMYQILNQLDSEMSDSNMPVGLRAVQRMRNQGRVMPKVRRDKIFRDVVISKDSDIAITELAAKMAEKPAALIKVLMGMGVMATINQSIDVETAELLISEMGHNPVIDSSADVEQNVIQKIIEDSADAVELPRSPIVTIMGHVDHGKTSLLDAYRNSIVVEGEAGGITQHIGAYQVECKGNKITFLDTPGHAAFTAMRLRGAMATDIVILIVAADDGIMEQTVEAISHAKAAGVPIIVAINKIDKPEADAQRVRNQLFMHELIPDDMGGDVMVVEISAAKRINLDSLLESILVQAEMLDLKCIHDRPAVGIVVESRMEKGRGVVATLLVKKGTLKLSDIIVAGSSIGKVRAMHNDLGKAVKNANPSVPVEVIGLDKAPTAGDNFLVVSDEKTAREIVDFNLSREKQQRSVAASSKKLSLEEMMGASIEGKKKLNVIVKADVNGSAEAIVASLEKIASDEIEVKVIHQAVGGISESDVTLAQASSAIIVGFNVRATGQAADAASKSGVDIRYYSIIYELIDEIKAAASGMLSKIRKENITGNAEVREVFNLSKYGKIAGCYVTNGIVKRSSHARLIRDSVVVYEGELKALKRFKDDVKEVKSGFECGISFDKYEDIKVGDVIEAYDITEEQQSLL